MLKNLDKAHDTLSDYCQQLVERGGAIQREKLSAPANDHLGFMIATFAARQLDQPEVAVEGGVARCQGKGADHRALRVGKPAGPAVQDADQVER